MKIRNYLPATDYEAVLALSERLADFEQPIRISKKELKRKQREWLATDLNSSLQSPKSHLLVLANDEGTIHGFFELLEETDWLTDQKQGYLSRICLAKEAEGMGNGKKLMLLAEEWAREQGYTGLTLMVMAANNHAQSFYQSLGYEVETMKMRKELM